MKSWCFMLAFSVSFSHGSPKIIINKICFVLQYAVISIYIYCIRCIQVPLFFFLWNNLILAYTSRTEMVGLLLSISDLHSRAPSSKGFACCITRLIMHVPMTFWAVHALQSLHLLPFAHIQSKILVSKPFRCLPLAHFWNCTFQLTVEHCQQTDTPPEPCLCIRYSTLETISNRTLYKNTLVEIWIQWLWAYEQALGLPKLHGHVLWQHHVKSLLGKTGKIYWHFRFTHCKRGFSLSVWFSFI